MNNQECNVQPQIANVDSNGHVFFHFSIKASKCSVVCNNINDPYTKLCVSDVVKNLNVKVFNLMSRTNETRPQNGMKNISVNVDQMRVFVIINNVAMMINAGLSAKN